MNVVNKKWNYKKLGDVCTVERGGSPRPIDDYITDDPSGINWIKIGDTNDESMFITQTAQKILPEGMKKSRYVRPGDFLLSNSMSFGRPYILKIDGCIHDGWLVLRDKENVFDKRFLYYYLSSNPTYQKFKMMAVGGVVNNLNSEMVRGVDVPIPGKDEQVKIADVLDKISRIIAYKKKELVKSGDLIKARFVEMFGDPVKNPFGLPLKKLSELGTLDRGRSKHRPRNAPELLNGPYPLIQTGEVAASDLYITEYHNTYSEMGLKQSKMWKAGTLCITIAANIAQTAIMSFDACFPDSVVGFVPGDKVSALYLHYWFGFFQKILEEQAPQVAQKNINLKILSDLSVIVPERERLTAFEDFVTQVDKSKVAVQKSLEQTQILFDSLMQQYFG